MKRYMLSFLTIISVFCFFYTQAAFAQEERGTTQETESTIKEEANLGKVVVTATKTEVSQDKLTKSVDVIDKEDMEAAKESYLPELLDNLPGVHLNRGGGTGQYSTVQIRGVSADYTQFQYNGIPLNDAGGTSDSITFFIEDMFMSSNVGQVEVLKGTGSTLYGSRAIGGVINIIPEKPKSGLHFESRSEYGGEDQIIQTARASYGSDSYYLDFCPVVVRSVGREEDNGYTSFYYENKGFSGRVGFKLNDLTIDINSLNFLTDLQSGSSPKLDPVTSELIETEPDENSHREGILSNTGLSVSHKVMNIWDYTIKGAYTKTNRKYIYDADVDGNVGEYGGQECYGDMQHNLYFGENFIFSIGADYKYQEYHGRSPEDAYSGNYTTVKFDYDYYTTDLYSQLQCLFFDEMIMFNIGGRYVMPEAHDNTFTYDSSIAFVYKPSGTKVRSGISSGYKMPSPYQLYGQYYDSSAGILTTIGNEYLEPEKSINYEIGIDQDIQNMGRIGGAVFYTEIENRIVYISGGYNQAEGKSYSKGLELYFNSLIASLVKVDVAYTYVKGEYKDADSYEWQDVTYLPNHKVSATVSLLPLYNFTAYFRASYRSSMKFFVYYSDYSGQPEYKEDGVLTFDCNIGYKVNDNVDVWVRGENILNKEYTEGGYFMPGRQIYGGIKITM
ncbi:MAG: TonB-dependent receptor [Spirochaetes bacterium]|nr:TonB-dependent receptor [Spirochaetota bacterium]